jgi:thiosulfate/3-mercaptopyruvate sulfurtransferase
VNVSAHSTSRTRRVALAAMLIGTVAAATGAARATPPHVAAADNMLVTTSWLASHLNEPGLVLLHVGEKGEYDAEHIPGARYVSLRDIAMEGADGLVLEMPPADDLRQRLEKLGISDDSRIIVYYGKDWVSPSTRVIFTLDYMGLGARTSLLDGGMGAWKREKRATTASVTPQTTGKLSARTPRPIVVDNAWVQKHLTAPGHKIVDARAPVFYDGPPHGDQRAGHLPGAVNIPFTIVANDSLVILSPEELTKAFRSAGVQAGDTVVAYCHIGQQATAVLFAARMIGHPVRLYDGSFQDWSKRAELPVEGGRK